LVDEAVRCKAKHWL